jgi:serine/threonine protein kinase
MATPPGAPAQKVPEVKIGDLVLDRYRVVEQIGSGGHSVVFRGTDERLARPVCVKVFSGLGGLSGVGRTSYEHFVQEAFALSRLTHPNTLRIYDFGHLGPKDAAGMPLQVCEYMNGGTLSQIIREQGQQGLPQTVRIISAMCAALSEAHGLGIVHRDIKPQNILFGSVGETRLPKLADFGIAKWSADTDADREQRAEDTAIVAGQKLAMYSPSWAAPEQLAGQPVSAATDIYSLAVVAIYMLTTKAIFADEDVYAGYKKRRHAGEHIQAALAPLGLPRSLTELLSRALAFDPKQRLVRVDDLATALEQLLDRSNVESDRAPAPVAPGSTQHSPPSVSATRDPVTPPAISVATAPMPPVIPMPMDMTPQTFHAPATQAWMANAPVPTGAVRRLPLADGAQPVADRRVHFAMVTSGIADLVGLHGTKVRVTLIPGPGGARNVHVKGLTCFIAPLGGRPSPAVSLTQSGDLALVTPRAQEIGHLRVIQGALEGPLVTFAIGNERVGVGLDDVADPILFDFGPGSDAYIVYTRGRTVPRPGRRG